MWELTNLSISPVYSGQFRNGILWILMNVKKKYFRKKIVFSYHQIQCFQFQLEIKATDLEKQNQNHAMNLSPGFCVRRPRQYNTICWELNLISGFFAFLWLIVWADGINKCGWCLAGGRGCWLKGPHQIPNVSWIFHYSLHFHIY